MDVEMQQQLDRVEAALNTLVDSITSYNPQPAAALALLAADDELNASVQRLAQHQANVQKLHSLRQSTAALDGRIKATMTLLADTRYELLKSTPLTVSDPTSRSVDSKDILNYAQRIARFTIPPTHRPPMPPAIEPRVPNLKTEDHPTPTNGIDSVDDSLHKEPPSPVYPSNADGKAIDTLTDEQKAWLDPSTAAGAMPFMPWPSEDTIRQGALSRIQAALERDENPATLDLTGAAPMEKPPTPQERGPVSTKPVQPVREEHARRREPTRQGSKASTVEDGGFGSFDLYDPDAED